MANLVALTVYQMGSMDPIPLASSVRMDFPFALPYDQANGKDYYQPSLQLYWDKLGNSFVWIVTSSTYNGSSHIENHTLGRLNLSTGVNHVFDRKWDESTKLLGVSPDGNWLLYYDSNIDQPPHLSGFYVLALKNNSVRHLVQDAEMSNYIHFYGWLTIP